MRQALARAALREHRGTFQVLASASIRTVAADSEPFSVAQKPRRAHILSPQSGGKFKQGEPVVLRGGGFSPDFGMSDFEDVAWSSSKDGVLGAGYELVVHTSQHGGDRCTPGPHAVDVFTRADPVALGGLSVSRIPDAGISAPLSLKHAQ